MNIIITGLKKITITVKTINGLIIRFAEPNTRLSPNETKKIVAKKSLNGFTRPIISGLYGRLANATPATNAPMIIDNPM